MSKTILGIAQEVLERSSRPLSPTKVYEEARKMGFEFGLNGKAPWKQVGARIYIDIRENPDSKFEVVNRKPMLISLKGKKLDENIINEEEEVEIKTSFSERDLHPLLVRFISGSENFQAYAKTIRHEISKKSEEGVDKWLYPDIVAVGFEYDAYEQKVVDFIERFSKLPIKIYAFEMKKKLSVGNFKKYYFQAVSNSSFANEGYLVALDIDDSNERLMELIKKLSSSFGIGVISLDSKDVSQSVILEKSRFRENLDFAIVNELSAKNDDFKKFLESVSEFDIKKSHRSVSEFDKVLEDDEEMNEYIKERGIC